MPIGIVKVWIVKKPCDNIIWSPEPYIYIILAGFGSSPFHCVRDLTGLNLDDFSCTIFQSRLYEEASDLSESVYMISLGGNDYPISHFLAPYIFQTQYWSFLIIDRGYTRLGEENIVFLPYHSWVVGQA